MHSFCHIVNIVHYFNCLRDQNVFNYKTYCIVLTKPCISLNFIIGLNNHSFENKHKLRETHILIPTFHFQHWLCLIVSVVCFTVVYFLSVFIEKLSFAEKYFEMNKKQCKEALDIYKKFLVRMDKVSEMLKVAEVCVA